MQAIIIILLLFFMPISLAQTHKPQDFLKGIAGRADEGTLIVQHYCQTCHGKKPLIPLQAPTIGDSKAWSPRLQQGLPTLFKHANEGLNAMPPRGGCFECTDKQLMLAILALLPKKK